MEIEKRLLSDISSYCSLNDLDEDKYINSILKKAFMTDKYGDRPEIYGSVHNNISVDEPRKIENSYSFTIQYKEKVVKPKRNKKIEVVSETEAVKPVSKQEEEVKAEEAPKKRKRKLEAK